MYLDANNLVEFQKKYFVILIYWIFKNYLEENMIL